MDFRLRCDLETLDMARSGAIWGGVWIEAGGEAFPHADWNDMPVAFIAELGIALTGLGRSDSSSRKVRFYDGPFWMMVDGSIAGQLVLTLGEPREKKVMTFPAVQVVESFISTASELLDACHARGWASNRDIVCLEGVVASVDQ
ncbi:hypothetical protein [Streptomyces sp. NBC_00847]|uniref:hypothetical protein n=1 Tax=Streptomyces sp. NBC_00847 TaxID=2975850 RepID=UPI00224E573B|nr:hypothetical protein [Streptomyces sp. NBC_00847]MCX4883527.1 hypothetical protein [Streptomyces sp. NBC_00847]